MKDPTVVQAKRFGVFSVTNCCSLLDAARQMAEEDISALVVVDENGFLEGILTRIDLLKARNHCVDWTAEQVDKWMSRQVVTVSPRERLSHVADLLLEKQIHRVVAVTEEHGKQRPVAVISTADLVYHMAKDG